MKIVTFNPWLNLNKDIVNNFNKKKDFFLGDWCLKNFDAIENNNFKILVGGDKNKKDLIGVKKFVFSYSYYNKILKNLCNSLNIFHKKKEKDNYWEFIISTWLWVYIDALQKRWNMVLQIKKRKFDKVITLDTKNVNLATTSSTDLKIISLNSILWNIKVFNEILKIQGFKRIAEVSIKKNFEKSNINKKFAALNVRNFSKFNKLNSKFFLYNLALPKKLRIKFLLKNLQLPLKSKIEKKNISLSGERKIRELWKKTYKFKVTSDKLENFLNANIYKTFPRIYLDKFKEVENISKFLNWPKKPKKILSSYAHFDDEIFKIYKSNLKTSKYYIFQHGAAGMYNEHVGQYFEEKLSDKYFTWGWKKNKNNYPLFVTSNLKKKDQINFGSKKIKVLLSIYQFPLFPQRSSYGYSKNFSRNTYYTNYLIKFLGGLNKHLIKNLFVKCLILYKPCLQVSLIKKKFKNIRFISTLKKSHQISHNFNLTIETFLSTGFFESMTLNRPVILLFDENLTNIDKRFLFWIYKLKKAKICFTTLKEANNFLNDKKFYFKEWWLNENLQKIRSSFCNEYSRDPEEYENLFEKII
jgi:putative transferase (TIGR04331 family)